MDSDIKALFQVLIESQGRTDKAVGELATVVSSHVALSDARFVRLEEAMDARFARLEQVISDFALGGNVRMTRIEEDLAGLIRAITREHSNGKSH